MPKVNVLYHHFPHYRRPVMQALNSSPNHTYRFFGGHVDVAGIKVFAGSDDLPVEPIGFVMDPTTGKMTISDYEQALEDCDALIVIGNPNIRATWRIALRARLKGVKVLFWAHGWLRPEPRIKSFLRNLYFRLPHRVLVYSERAVDLAARSGFPADRIKVIYNSLDFPTQNVIYQSLVNTPRDSLRGQLGLDPHRPILLCVSRLTGICHYDWLLKSAARAPLSDLKPCLVFIGDGPTRIELEALATELKVDAIFLGALYDEALLGRYIMSADAVVSPGKVGLTAMHALAFGTPVVTHGNLDTQMPEVEAVVPGQSGAYFAYGDVDGLGAATTEILGWSGSLEQRREACRKIILEKYTPNVQRQLIDEAIDALI